MKDVAVPSKSRKYDDWDVREALRTLTEAAKIQKNKALMGLVRKEAQKQLDAAKSTASALKGS